MRGVLTEFSKTCFPLFFDSLDSTNWDLLVAVIHTPLHSVDLTLVASTLLVRNNSSHFAAL